MNVVRRGWLLTLAAALLPTLAVAQSDTVKVGLILPLTGPFASTGRQIEAAARLYMAQNGTTVAGKKIELVVKDDTGTPDVAKRIAQEMANDKVAILAGFGLTPIAMAVAPIATQAKVPEVVMAAGSSMITEASPYVVRTSFTVAQSAAPMAEWAAKNGIRKVVTIVSDYAPGLDAEKAFSEPFVKAGGKVENVRVPLRNPDFAPFLQRAADEKPDALFVFVPVRRGRAADEAVLGAGSRQVGNQADRPGRHDRRRHPERHGRRRARHDHDAVLLGRASESPRTRRTSTRSRRRTRACGPNFMSVGGYDGMHLIYEALKKTNGNTDGDALVAAMKGMSWTSPRGPISIDPATRDIVQNIYVRKVEKVGGELYNVEFATIPNVKDPVKAAAGK